MMYHPYPIRLKFEYENGDLVFMNFRENRIIPDRNDIIFWEGENYKIKYRKFIYSIGNRDLETVIFKVEKIDKKF